MPVSLTPVQISLATAKSTVPLPIAYVPRGKEACALNKKLFEAHVPLGKHVQHWVSMYREQWGGGQLPPSEIWI